MFIIFIFVSSLNATPSCPRPNELVTIIRSETGIAYLKAREYSEQYYWVFQGTLNENPDFWHKIALNNELNNNDHLSAINKIVDKIISGNITYKGTESGYVFMWLVFPYYITEKQELGRISLEVAKENFCKYKIQNYTISRLFGIKLFPIRSHSFFYLKLYSADEFSGVLNKYGKDKN